MMRKNVLIPLLFCLFVLRLHYTVYAQDAVTPKPTDTPTGTLTPTFPAQGGNSQQVQDLQHKISELEGKISDLQGQELTLSQKIKQYDNQITLTQYKIDKEKRDIVDAQNDITITEKRMAMLDSSLSNLTKVLLDRIKATYMVGSNQPLQILFTANNANDFFTKENYLRAAQAHDKRLVYDTEQAKNDYANQKSILEDKKKKIEALQAQLVIYAQDLDQQKTSKQKLLKETQGSEANYQRQVAQAKALLAGFSSFVANQGGASILSGQTFCDSWGCYYNQRDSQWGGISLNHTQYTIASDGCLITSMAMVMTHYGHPTTPLDINANPDNFASYYPAYMLFTTIAKGVTAQRTGTIIDTTINDDNHDPVIVGVHAYGGTHFVVIKSGGKGDYLMNDPYIAAGHDIPFTAHYSMSSIFEVDKVTIL